MLFAALIIICGFPFKAMQLLLTHPSPSFPDPFWNFSWTTFNHVSWQHCLGGLIFQGVLGFVLLIFYNLIMCCLRRPPHSSLQLSSFICADNWGGCAGVSGEMAVFCVAAAILIIGLYATVAATYKLLSSLTSFVLTRIEDSVLEVKD